MTDRNTLSALNAEAMPDKSTAIKNPYDNDFIDIDLTSESPPAVCPRCASEEARQHAGTGVLFCYCRHRTVGISRTPGGEWFVARRLSAVEFRTGMALAIQCEHTCPAQGVTDG